MSASRRERKFTQIIDRLEEQPGTDLNRDLLKIALTAVDVSSVDQNITEIGGEPQSAVDVANQIDRIEAALASTGGDQLRVDLQNNNAGNLPFTLEANNAGTLAVEQQSPVVIEGSDDAGNTASIQAEELGTALGGTETAIITYVAQALAAIGNDQLRVDLQNNNAGTLPTEQQSPVQLEDSTGTNINPSEATEFPNNQTTGYDLIGSGDLVVGPVSVAKAEAVVIAANSTDGNTFSVSVDWEDGSGNVFQEESATDIGLADITQDYSRLIRKGPQVEVTFTDTSGGSTNNINAHVDAQR